jgi:hemoglobin
MDAGVETAEAPITEAQIKMLVPRFYARVRADDLIGPVFDNAIDEWAPHLEKLMAFWSSVMLTTGRYKGNPMMAHMKHLATITPPMFDRWLAIWADVTAETMPAAIANELQAKAARIAQSLSWRCISGCRRAASPSRAPDMTSTPYRSTPEFDEVTLPAALRSDHRTKAGAWGVIHVLEGALELTFVDPPSSQILTPGRPGLVLPQQTHFVTPVGAMRMRVDFHASAPDMAMITNAAAKPKDAS